GGGPPLRLRDVAEVSTTTMPGEYDRYNMRRVASLTANVEGEDLGRVAGHIARALAAVNESHWVPGEDNGKQGWRSEVSGEFVEGGKRPKAPPRGLQVDVRGQVVPMEQMFWGLAVGLALAVVAIFLLLTAYFQSLRLALVVILAAPAVVAGVALALV